MSRRESLDAAALREPTNSGAAAAASSSSPTAVTSPTANKAPSFVRTYARIRPLLKDEAKKIPDYHPIPRPALITAVNADPLDDEVKEAMAMANSANTNEQQQKIQPNGGIGKEIIVVCDPDKHFARRKNGAFAFKRVFPMANFNEWEPETATPVLRPVPVTSGMGEVFAEVRPMIEATCSRMNTACIVCGGSRSGKMTTMFGDLAGTDPEARGVLPRYTMEIFRALQGAKHDNAEVKCEIEFIEINGDNITDLLLPASERAHAFPVRVKDEGHSLVTLTNCTRNVVTDGPNMLSQIKAGLRVARRKDTHSHLVLNFRITEKADYEHPDDSTQRVTKVSSFWAQFALVSQMPTAFVRCIDIAAQKESDKNVALKVPVRDSMITRLTCETYGGNCETYCIVCASPFWQQSKESLAALEAVAKFSKVKCRATITADQQTSTFRRLTEEMSGISSAITEASEAQNLVQQELNDRQSKLEEAASRLEAQRTVLENAEKHYGTNELLKIVKALRLLRIRRAGDVKRKALENELAAVDEALKKVLNNVVTIAGVNEELAEDVDNLTLDQQEAERAISHLQDEITDLQHREEEFEMLKSDPAEQRAQLAKEHEAKMSMQRAEIEAKQKQLKEAEEVQKAAERDEADAKKEEEQTFGGKKRLEDAKRKNAALEKEKKDLEQQVEELEMEMAKVDADLKKPPAGCCCVI